ncbi:trypsin-like serine peptidase [Hyalangium rubrum]|uniref:Serine protease n=1 Tax=Hyalangium rubrum TaxID=3103134 RepID=A0ABU5HFM9_9BACT|nr:serine protease [Hyalangium sp. s54d21]MDY7232277.1 serine protease [Hyalangium sp. s54d21]
MRIPWRTRFLGPLLCTLAVGCGSLEEGEPLPEVEPLGESKAPVVYGTDNRTDVYAHADATLRIRAQQSTVALMRPGVLNTSSSSNVTFSAQTLGAYYNLCTTERFRDDLTPAFCSGTLIDDDLVLTAGHCITSASDCSNTRFVFNFYRTASGTMQTVTTADVFSCQSIVARAQGTVNGQNLDYAVVRLDRAAAPRFTPAPVRPGNSAMAAGQPVAVIGSGSGIPYKIDSGGSVRDARAGTLDYFVASTDTFGGNSGSGVYELSDYTVAGILVRGETDYVSNGSCRVVNVCTETGCRGEDITYVRPAINAYCQVAGSMRLCGTSEPPPPPPPPENGLNYTATNTDSAQQNTVNQVLALTAGQKITLGTCGVTGSAFTGDTYLRLFGPGGTEVAGNDDACGGRGSSLSFTVPAGGSGNYEVRAGCYSSGSCTGTVVWEIVTGTPPSGGSYTFSASNTSGATKNTVNKDVAISAGQAITLGTCGVTGSAFSGDTYLRLFGPGGTEVASNDDACSGAGSNLGYTATTSGTYQIRAGCYSNKSCSGTVAWMLQ